MRVLALDVGDVRVGVAMSDPLGMIASPLPFAKNKEEILEIINKYSIKTVVVGIPKSLDGTEKRQAEKTRDFIKALIRSFEGKDIKIVEIDERYTTKIAQDSIKTQGKGLSKYKNSIDSLAASILLQEFLNR